MTVHTESAFEIPPQGDLVSVKEKNSHSDESGLLKGYEKSKLYLETIAMCEHCMSIGLDVNPEIIQQCELIRSKVVNGLIERDIGLLANLHQQLVKVVAPAAPQNLLLIEVERDKNSFFSFISLIPVVRSIIGVSLIFLLSFVMLGQLEIVNEQNLKAGILGSHGLTAIALLGYLVSCAGLGACFTSLYRIREYVSKLTFDPRYNSSYWASILLGSIAGLFISELLYSFIFSATEEVGHNAQLGKPALALLAGFSSNMVYTLLQRIVDSIESLFKGDQRKIQQAKHNADLGELKNKENEIYIQLSQKLIDVYQNGDKDPEAIRKNLKSTIDELLVKR